MFDLGSTNKTKFICFKCRNVFKHYKYGGEQTCPTCGQLMVAMSYKFKPPKKKDSKQWRKVAAMLNHRGNVAFYCTDSCCWGKPQPSTLSDAKSKFSLRKKKHFA